MKLKRYLFLILMTAVSTKAFSQKNCPIIPLPQNFESVKGHFVITPRTPIIVKDTSLKQVASFFKNQLLRYAGMALSSKSHHLPAIVLQKKKSYEKKKEGYSLNIRKDKIVISAADNRGVFNGVASLLQLALHAKDVDHQIKIKCWDIDDAPLYSWRGFMLDESRHFFGKETVKKILDRMALLKLNRFHWHLTDAPGWRIEIKKYPLLSLIGGIGDDSDTLQPAQYYTQEDIREIVAYAKQRHIVVIPEIDMPGHATAANRAYPELSGGGTGKYANFTFNPGKTETYDFLANVLKEVAILFPSGMIHIGGDEVSFGSESWNNDPAVTKLRQEKALSNLKDVEYYFLERMADSALKSYRWILAWDEAADASLSTDSTIIFWWRHDKPKQLNKSLAKGFPVVLCPRIPLYLDFVQDSSHQQGRRWAGQFSSVKQVYSFSMNTYPIKVKNKSLIQGIQANLWTEQISSERRLEFMLFPRLAALAEAAWTVPDKRNYTLFLDRLKGQFQRYKKEHLYYFNPIHPRETPEVIDEIN